MDTFYRGQHELIFVYKHGTESHQNNFELGQHGPNRSNVWSFPSVRALDAEDGDPETNEAHKPYISLPILHFEYYIPKKNTSITGLLICSVSRHLKNMRSSMGFHGIFSTKPMEDWIPNTQTRRLLKVAMRKAPVSVRMKTKCDSSPITWNRHAKVALRTWAHQA